MRELWVDRCKGFNMIGVVAYHLTTTFAMGENGKIFHAFAYWDIAFSMSLFFVISGYCYMISSEKRKLERKVSRIFYRELDIAVPYIVFSALYYCIHMDMSIVQIISKYWFMPALGVVVFVVILFINPARVEIWTVAALALTVISGMVNNVLAKMIYYILCYLIGMCIYKHKKMIQSKTVILLSGLVFIAYGTYYYIISGGTYIVDVYPKMIAGISGTLFVMGLFKWFGDRKDVLSEVGKYTLIIYFLHMHVWDAIKIIYDESMPTGISLVLCLGGIAVACVLSVYVQRFVFDRTFLKNILFPSKLLRQYKKKD